MAVNLSPIWGAGAQLLDNSGNVLSGGKIYTYAAGTTTQVTTFTDGSGVTAHSNPIILNSAGRVPYEIWLTDGQNYKFVLKDSNDVLIGTWDNLSGINSNFVNYVNQQEIQTATAGQTVFNLTTMQYLPGTNNLSVFVDGVNQYGPGAQYAYTETDSNTVTFASGLHVGAEVKFTSTQIQNAGAIDAAQVSYDPPFIDSTATNVEAKLSQYVSVQDFGAVLNGTTNDTVPVTNARNAVSANGGMLTYGGDAAGGTDIRPLATEWVLGSSTSYADGLTAKRPLCHTQIYNQTSTTVNGFDFYGQRIDMATKSGVDVQSSVGFASILQSYSTNSGGTPTDNATNQVAAVFNASAMTSTASASPIGVNVIVESLYTGAGTHTLNGLQINMGSSNNPGFFNNAGTSYGVGQSIINVGNKNLTIGLDINTSTAGVGFLHGITVVSGIDTAMTVARNTVTPGTGLWVSAATTYGVYVGAKQLYPLNPGTNPSYDSNHNPVVGICLGQRAAASGESNKLRFVSTSTGSSELIWDVYTDLSGGFNFDYAGANKAAISNNGYYYVQGDQVVAKRINGWGTPTGNVRISSFNAATATTTQTAQALAQLLIDLETHGLIGA